MTADGATRREVPADREPRAAAASADGATRRENASHGATRTENASNGATRREILRGTGDSQHAGDPGLTRQETASGGDLSWHRINLPEPLVGRYQVLRELESSGAQADLLVCVELATGNEVVVKLYRRGIVIDETTIERLRDSLRDDHARDHVVPIIDFTSWRGVSWEIQEFFPHGSLADRLSHGPTGFGAARDVLVELSQALTYLHGLDIVHRDLKPQNVLVRTPQPLDLVLADFGLAAELVLSFDVRSLAGSFPYLAPEVSSANKVSKAGDWWSLGVIMYEALHGRHLFTDDTSQLLLGDAMIKNQLAERRYRIEPTGDQRWDLLLAGLLTHDSDRRWGSREISRWLAGDTPVVHADARTMKVQPFPFGDRSYHDCTHLAAALREEWRKAGAVIATPDRRAELRMWLRSTSVENRADRVLTGDISPDPALVRLQIILDPDSPPSFRGRPLSDTHLNAVMEAARAADPDAVDWLRALRERRILSAWSAEAEVPETLRLADGRLSGWWETVDEQLSKIPASEQHLTATVRAALEPQLLAAALDAGIRTQLVERGRRALRDHGHGLPDWANDLVDDLTVGMADPGCAAVAFSLLPEVHKHEQERLDQVAAEERERRRAERRRDRQDRLRTVRRRFGSALRGSLLLCTIAAVITAVLLVLLSGERVQSAVITAAILWAAVALGWAAREFVGAATTTRLGNVLFVLALAWGLNKTALAVVTCAGCSGGDLPSTTWNSVPLAVVAGAWAMRFVNLGVDVALRGRADGREQARVLRGPATMMAAITVALQIVTQINVVVASTAGSSLVDSALDEAPAWALSALAHAAAFVAPLVNALPTWAVAATPPAATLTALILLIAGHDLRRWHPSALTGARLAMIVLGLLTAAIWIYSLGTVLLLLGYLVVAVVVIAILVWVAVVVFSG